MTTTIVKDILHFLDELRSSDQVSVEVKKHALWIREKYDREERSERREDTLRIEVSFPRKVYVADRSFQRIADTIGEICKDYEARHPGRVMWPAGMGSKITYMPMTREEELAGRHMEFDDDTLSIDCCEREDYDWSCKKCGITQGDHKTCIINPPAGDCDFEPAEAKPPKQRKPSHGKSES